MQGAIANSGVISLLSIGNDTRLVVGAAGLTLSGGGQLTLTNDSNNAIIGATSAATLTNIDNTISGAGQLGDGQLTLVNRRKGVIDANGYNGLVINAGGSTIVNAGLIEATSGGALTIQDNIDNTGILEVYNANFTENGAVTGGGSVLIDQGTLTFTSSFNERARFAGFYGSLRLAQSQSYSGPIFGFSTHGEGGDVLDLRDIAFVGSNEATFSGNRARGTLVVTDGTHTANITLIGDYAFSTFVAFSDGAGGTNVELSFNAPLARPDAYKVGLGGSLTTTAKNGVLANDVDPNGLALTAALVVGGGPTHGTLSLNPDGSFTYTPSAGFTGTDTFSYTAGDGLDSSSPATVTLTVKASPPVSNPDFYGDGAGQALTTNAANGVLANDSDPNGRTLTAALARGGGPSHGTLTLNADGSFTYTPTLGFAGTDTFSYIASDGLTSGPATLVTLTVTASPPTSNPDSYKDHAGRHLTTTAANGVLANDSDPNGLTLTAALAPGGGPAHGALTLNADGSFTYTPTLGFAGTDTFSYIASDGLASGPATLVTLTVGASTPTSSPDSYNDHAGRRLATTAANGVLANDSDPNGLTLTAALAPRGGPAHGALKLNSDGSFSYTPNLGFAGTDSFSYIASDGLASGPATLVTLTVNASSPTSNPDNYSDIAGQTLSTTAANGVLANDSDPNGLPLSASLAAGGGPAHGRLTLNADGSFTYTPNAGFSGVDAFSYVASDGLASGPATAVTITVTGGAPISNPDTYSDAAGHTLTTTAANGVLANDSDPNGLPLSASLAPGGGPAHGTLTLNSDGSFTYNPTKGFVGADNFSYIASDGVASGPATLVTVNVAAAPPHTNPDTYSAIANQTLNVDASHGVLANDSDPNGRALTAALAPGGAPVYGSVTLNPDGSFSYILNSGFGGFSGTDTFSYIASDGAASSGPTLVTIDVSNGRMLSAPAPALESAALHQRFVAAMAGFAAPSGGGLHPAFEAALLAEPVLAASKPASVLR